MPVELGPSDKGCVVWCVLAGQDDEWWMEDGDGNSLEEEEEEEEGQIPGTFLQRRANDRSHSRLRGRGSHRRRSHRSHGPRDYHEDSNWEQPKYVTPQGMMVRAF